MIETTEPSIGSNSTNSEISEFVQLNPESLERGHKSCRGATKSFFKSWLWVAKNLPGDQRRGLDTILFNLMRTIDLLDLESATGLSLDVWYELRDDLSDAFRDRCSSVELAALVDTARKFDVPKQFLFDPLRGADLWIRNRKFETFEELESFCSYVGGSSLASAMPILGVIKPDYEVDAIECGKAIMLTQLLANCIDDAKVNRIFLAESDLKDCEVDPTHLKLRRGGKPLRFIVRLYVSRIEKMFMKSRHLIQHLDYDGKRTLKSLLAMNWKMLMKMQLEPECILNEEGILSGREQLILKSRHLMGMEKDLAICVDEAAHH
jgi:phytoene synthase